MANVSEQRHPVLLLQTVSKQDSAPLLLLAFAVTTLLPAFSGHTTPQCPAHRATGATTTLIIGASTATAERAGANPSTMRPTPVASPIRIHDIGATFHRRGRKRTVNIPTTTRAPRRTVMTGDMHTPHRPSDRYCGWYPRAARHGQTTLVSLQLISQRDRPYRPDRPVARVDRRTRPDGLRSLLQWTVLPPICCSTPG